MARKAPALTAAAIAALAACATDDFEDRAGDKCEQSYQRVVGGPEWPDRSGHGHEVFVRECVQGEQQKREEAQQRRDDSQP